VLVANGDENLSGVSLRSKMRENIIIRLLQIKEINVYQQIPKGIVLVWLVVLDVEADFEL
jgi:hypothetical protein